MLLQQIQCCSHLSGFCSAFEIGAGFVGIGLSICFTLMVDASISHLEKIRVCENLASFAHLGLTKILPLPLYTVPYLYPCRVEIAKIILEK